MKLLFTGSSGFLGQNIIPLLNNYYEITTLGLSSNDDYKVNLSKDIPTFIEKFDLVLHAAGKAHVTPTTEKEKNLFFNINYQGTKNLISGLEISGNIPKSIIFISSVAVYGVEFGINIDENQELLCTSPYAVSKMKAEEFLINWCLKNNVILGILRPSIIVGKNSVGNLKSMINGIKNGYYLRIGSSSARKSMLMAEDIAIIIPKLAEVGGIYNLCDNHHPSFAELEELISKQLNKKLQFSVPYWFAKILAFIGDIVGERFPVNSNKLSKITQTLTFSNEKAKRELQWEPLDVLQNFKI